MDVAELPLVGGHPALDLVNTVERGTPAPGGQPLDYLTDPPALLRWARRVSMVDEAEVDAVTESWERDPSSAHAALAAVRDVREALHVALLAAIAAVPSDTGTVAGALERLHSRWAAAVGRSRLVLEPEGAAAAQLAVGATPGPLVPDRAAAAAVDALRTADLAPRCRGLRLGLPGPEPQRLAPVVPDGRLRNNGQGPPSHRASTRRPGAFTKVATC
jgi:hypothetical protein